LALSATAFGTATDGSDGTAHALANAITSAVAAGTGTAGYFRAYSSGGTCHDQDTVGLATSGFIISAVAIASGDTVACTSWTIKQADGSGSD
jgi:hypothetical protein